MAGIKRTLRERGFHVYKTGGELEDEGSGIMILCNWRICGWDMDLS
jgi:hypothetical protein